MASAQELEGDGASEYAGAGPAACFPSPMRPSYQLSYVLCKQGGGGGGDGGGGGGGGGGRMDSGSLPHASVASAPMHRSVANGLHQAKMVALRAAYEDSLERNGEVEFERVFPSPSPELQAVYSELLRRSQRCLHEERLAADGAWCGGDYTYHHLDGTAHGPADAPQQQAATQRSDSGSGRAAPNQPACYVPHEFAVQVDGVAPSARSGNLATSRAAKEAAAAEAEEAAAAAAALERAAAEARAVGGLSSDDDEEEDEGSEEDDSAPNASSGGTPSGTHRLGRLLKKAKKAKSRPRSKKKRPKKKIRSLYVPFNQLI